MTSAERRGEPLEALLREHGVEPALAERIRALVERPRPAVDPSSTRPVVSHPPTRQNAPSRSTIERVAQLLTQPARPARRAQDPDATPPVVEAESLGSTTTWADFAPPAAGGALLVPLILLGEGGMGEVHRARDVVLGRDIAMKVLHDRFSRDARMRARFLDEAQITAQLAHPSIPPVHTLGQLEDGRPFFTMKEVHGRTLADIVDEGNTLSEQRRLEIFQRVCEAVAYAHARGVIHCDLKPLNVMVGAFGEVLVMDWGVAYLVAPASSTEVDEPPVHTTATTAEQREVAGTPAYMPPEQALADRARIGPASDVYALGVMLYELLAGQRPYHGGVPQLLFLAAQGIVPPIPRREGSTVDDALEAIIAKAMRPDPADRYRDASALGEEVARWREGAMRREKAIAIVQEAEERLRGVEPLRERARVLRDEAQRELAALAPGVGPEIREAAWAKEDGARDAAQAAELGTAEVEQKLEAALVHAPELKEARALLADLAYERHHQAEARRAWGAAALHEVRLRAYDVGKYEAYLGGRAKLTLATDVPAEAHLFRYVHLDRRLALEKVRELGSTPLVDVELPVGSYMLELHAAGRPAVRVPFALRRRTDCVFSRDGSQAPTPIELPPEGEVLSDEVLVAAGWFCAGADPRETSGERTWVEAFVMQRDPVTFRALMPFLTSPEGEPYREGVLRDGLGLFHPDWPAVGISWEGAQAFASWLASRTGLRWRLPYELEWEKAARGADGRLFPWGDAAEPSFAHVRGGGRTPVRPAPVDACVHDVSPFGVRGMAGNVREWCADADVAVDSVHAPRRTPSGGLRRRIARGGSFRLPLEAAQSMTRGSLAAGQGYLDVGVRLVRPLRSAGPKRA